MIIIVSSQLIQKQERNTYATICKFSFQYLKTIPPLVKGSNFYAVDRMLLFLSNNAIKISFSSDNYSCNSINVSLQMCFCH